ncbi:hypothetical protein LO80_06525 [Candidatus Francisella endociliophora]|uniref:Uncharacterized protein n=1 Tax=Candidatus Francisella endociliophora TaxID=653937 RepID=A0A097EQ32_9GAMM|nr:hypothetical protein [Francisella sp. FSC1006]AIT09651.1 hypothetical protein LO80_06525 [Francisella sp. FSC1006]
MKKNIFLLAATMLFSAGFSANIDSGSTVQNTKPSDHATPMAMNATPTPMSKEIKEGNIPNIDQPKQQEQLVGSNSNTWTPAYLKVKKFKKCLDVQDYRGWEGYCLPSKQPKKCPDKSWNKLSEMNLIPCAN